MAVVTDSGFSVSVKGDRIASPISAATSPPTSCLGVSGGASWETTAPAGGAGNALSWPRRKKRDATRVSSPVICYLDVLTFLSQATLDAGIKLISMVRRRVRRLLVLTWAVLEELRSCDASVNKIAL